MLMELEVDKDARMPLKLDVVATKVESPTLVATCIRTMWPWLKYQPIWQILKPKSEEVCRLAQEK